MLTLPEASEWGGSCPSLPPASSSRNDLILLLKIFDLSISNGKIWNEIILATYHRSSTLSKMGKYTKIAAFALVLVALFAMANATRVLLDAYDDCYNGERNLMSWVYLCSSPLPPCSSR